MNREAAQDSQARGILKANQPTNQKSDLMQEVDLLGVVQDALVSKLVGHATDQAQVETNIHKKKTVINHKNYQQTQHDIFQ